MERTSGTPVVVTILNISVEQSPEVQNNLDHLAEWDAWDYWPEAPGARIGYGEMDHPKPEEELDWLARHVWDVTGDYRPILLSVRPGTPEVKVYATDEKDYQEWLAVEEERARAGANE